MSLWSRIAGLFRKSSVDMSLDAWWSTYGPSLLSAGGVAVTQVSAMQAAAVMACVSILAEDVAKLPVHVFERKGDGSKRIVVDHPLERLFRRPNAWQSRFEFFECLQASLLLRGNGYACIVRDSRGNPTSLVPVNPDRVWIYEAPDGQVFYMVARRGPHDIATLRSLPWMVHSDDMLHVRWLAMDNTLWGVSRIGLAREAIGLALTQQEMAGRLSANNTVLGGVLSTDQKLTDTAIARMRKDWDENKGGARNAGQTAILEQGLKWQPLGMTGKDAEFVASRNLQVLEICRIFRMPPHKVGVIERMAGGTLDQLDQDYVNNTVSSYLDRWEGALDRTFGLTDDEVFVDFDLTKFLRASLQQRYTAYRTGIMGTFLTPNEARRAEGLPDKDGGDDLYKPANVNDLNTEPPPGATGIGSDVTGAPASGGRGDGAAPLEVPDDETTGDEAPSG